ncbi:telomeric repeat-binding factor 2-interacting protein 1 [Rhinoraja longicauda]
MAYKTRSRAATSELPSHSRTLFLRDDGLPFCFYIRPGPTKALLQPLILHGGGVMCRVQEPGAILLTEPGESAPWTSRNCQSQYVLDCVQKNEQLPLQNYVTAAASKLEDVAYSKLEDVAILMYVRENDGACSLRGYTMWREMERAQVTCHSWQSMRTRYLRHLRGCEHLYDIDSCSVIPPTVFHGAQPPEPQEGKKNGGILQHTDPESNKGVPIADEQESDGINSGDEFFNIFPVAIQEFESDENSEQMVEISDVTEEENIPQEQEMETDKPPKLGLGERRLKRKGTNTELILDNEQMEMGKPPKENLGEPCAKRTEMTAKIMDNKQVETENPPEMSFGDYHTKKKVTLSEFVMNNTQSESDSQILSGELSLPAASQNEVECATRAISTLMQACDLDLCTATQLLLKNSGELAAALHFVKSGHRPDGYPIWTCRDDLDLENVDREVQEGLIQKFGPENLAKRIAFRKSYY